MRLRLAILIALLLKIATPSFATGVLSYTARPAVVGARPGDTVSLVATLRNTGDMTLYVNDVSVLINGQQAAFFRPNLFFNFFNSVPGTFESTDQDFTGSVHEVVVDPNTPPGTYTVTVGIIGGDNPSSSHPVNNAIGSQTFTIIVVPAGALPLTVPGNGATSVTSNGNGPSTVGYGKLQSFSGNATPAGLAIIGLRQNGVLISETGISAVPAVQSGRIYADVSPEVNTGIAMANPNDQAAFISYYFTNANGDFKSGTTTIPANGQIASFLDQAPFSSGLPVSGTFTFSSSVPIAAVAIRGRINGRREFLMSTLPVADLSLPATTTPVVFPHVADGGGWTTQIVLVNTGDTPMSGTVQFFPQSGASTNSSYSIERKSSQTLQMPAGTNNVTTGWARVVPAPNTAAPTGVAIFSYRTGGVLVTEAGVPAVTAATGFHMYAEASDAWGSPTSIQTGIAVVNPSATPATVTVSLAKLDGTPAATGTLSLPANGQTAVFLSQIAGLNSIPRPFRGVARISSSSPISVTGLRARYNERLDFLITTTPAIPDSTPPSSAPLYFPQIADSGGYTTQFIILGRPPDAVSGTLQLTSPSGAVLNIPMQ